jgi:hypothetical protein
MVGGGRLENAMPPPTTSHGFWPGLGKATARGNDQAP